MKLDDRTGTLELSPHWLQFLCMEIIPIFLCFVLWVILGLENFVPEALRPFLLAFGCCLLMFLGYKLWYMMTIRYEITSQQLMFQHGVFNVERSYVELYRVVDYEERRNFLQMLMGLKTVCVYSGDRTTPRLDIIGVRQKTDLQTFIRERVEIQKKSKHIYEITNR